MVSLKSFRLINETEGEIDDPSRPATNIECYTNRHQDLYGQFTQANQLGALNEGSSRSYEIDSKNSQTMSRKSFSLATSNNALLAQSSNENNNNHEINNQNDSTRSSSDSTNFATSNILANMNNSGLEQTSSHQQLNNGNIMATSTEKQIDSNNSSTESSSAEAIALEPPRPLDLTAGIENNMTPNRKSSSISSSSSSISIIVVKHKSSSESASTNLNISSRHDNIEQHSAIDDKKDEIPSQSCSVSSTLDKCSNSEKSSIKLDDNILPSSGFDAQTTLNNGVFQDNLIHYASKISDVGQRYDLPKNHDMSVSRLSVNTESEHFEIVWSTLSYRIEPKWHKKINYLDRMLSYFMPGQTVDNHSSATSTASSSAGMNDNQHQMHVSANADSHLTTAPKQRSPSDPIEIFTNLNGTIKSGQMTAVLGPSGAGKTTLLNCLTGKLRKGVSGHINLKGANGKHLKMCTIPQKDHLLEQLTVEENLWFASKIKNPEYGFDHVKNIERVIDLLGLKRCRSAKIKKISGGQHKRVSIAQELLSNPDILVLDEPTSGLDSLTCYKTISMLRDLVELSANNDYMKPMAIIVTIHQPQPKVFNLFHHVYILANGGRVIYEGPPEQSVATITGVTGLRPTDISKSASPTSNAIDPASFLIEIASEEYGADVIGTLSDHQRNIFHLNHGRKGKFRESYPSTRVDSMGKAKVNHGFSPEFESEKANDDISSVIVMPEDGLRQAETATTTSQEMRQRSILKAKRKKKSRKDEDNNSNSSQSEDQAAAHDPNLYLSEQLLYTRVPNHKGRFWSHTATLTHRTLLTIRRDPLLMTSRVLFHLMIPILMGHVYGKATGAANACPHYEPEIDITQIPSLVESKRIEFMLEELHMSIENVSMFFIIMYAFAAAVLALNALSFPLNMQVLLKETRNGWYSMSSYVLAKTLADLPLELTMPCMTMLLVYPLTGQPSSYLQWRMLTICLIMTLCSLIAQTQALILGALVMNSVQTAVFVSQASQLPWVILAGFTIRIKRLSEPLKLISLTSFYRLGCEAITLTRYGFGICPCDPQEITGQPVRLVGIPDQLRTVAQYWIDSVEASKAAALNETLSPDGDETTVSSLITTTLAPSSAASSKTDIFQHLANQLSYANSYGVNITSCDDVAPDRIRAINLGDNWLVARIWHLIIMLIIMKVLLYYAVRFSIGIRL